MFNGCDDDPQAPLRHLIRQRRRILGLSRRALAAATGLPEAVIRRIEGDPSQGRRRVKPDEVAALARGFGVPVEELWPPAAGYLAGRGGME